MLKGLLQKLKSGKKDKQQMEMQRQKDIQMKKMSKLYPRVRSDIPADYKMSEYPSNEFGQITNINNQAIKNQQQSDAYEREIKRGIKTGKSNLRSPGP
jgi:hypothetical protein